MADAERVFANGTDAKRNAIKMLWPELYDALSGINPDGTTTRPIWCVIGDAEHRAARVPAAGRLTRMGHPACADHIARMSDRPGGWPLPAKDNQ